MRGFFKRLLNREQQPEVMADYATDEWAPVPAGACAQAPNMVSWLTEPSVVLPQKRADQSSDRPRRNTLRRMVHKLRDYMDHLSPEERAIVEQQQAQSSSKGSVSASTASVAELRPPQVAAQPLPVAPTAAAPAAPAVEQDATWLRVVETYGSHLTEEELQIIYRQLKEG